MAGSPFIPDVVAQHRENAASLWLARSNAVRRTTFRLGDLIKLDSRLDANIDGLRIAQKAGWSGWLDELDQGDAGDFFAAAVLALESGDPGQTDQVIERAYAKMAATAMLPYHAADDPWAGLLSALAWVRSEYAAGTVARLLHTPRPTTRRLGIAACGARRMVSEQGLAALLTDAEPMVRARAARVIGELGRLDTLALLIVQLTDPDKDCRFWAAWSAARLGDARGMRVLAEFVQEPGPRCDCALDLLLRRLPTDRANEYLKSLARNPLLRRAVIRGTGVIGDPLYLPWLIVQAGDSAVAQVAGDAFVAITGADPTELSQEAPDNLEPGPNDDPDDERVASDDDAALAWPRPDKLDHWWKENQSRFTVGTSCFLGVAKHSANWIDVLLESVQRRRWSAALELALASPRHAMFEVRARGDLQRRLLQQVVQRQRQ